MVNSTLSALGARRSTLVVGLVVGVVACVAAALALGATAASAAACENEGRRQESDFNLIAGEPYSAALPDCRAYEMVSPLFKQGHDVEPNVSVGIPVSPDGEAVGYASEGGFAGTENYHFSFPLTVNTYLSHRTGHEWTTESSFAPANLVSYPYRDGLSADYAPDLRSSQGTCGYFSSTNKGEEPNLFTSFRCAMRKERGEWTPSPEYTTVNGEPVLGQLGFLGGSTTMSRLFVQPGNPVLPSDKLKQLVSVGIYEAPPITFQPAGGVESPTKLRLVNVDNHGVELTNMGAGQVLNHERAFGPLLGDHREETKINGSDYHAISESGETVFFTATPTATQQPEGQQQTVYARTHCVSGSSPSCTEDGNAEWLETVAVSNPTPSQCTESGCPGPSHTCPEEAELIANRATAKGEAREAIEKQLGECHGFHDATFQGASADGSKVFFTTDQRLLKGDTDETQDLYEYDFTRRSKGENPLIQISAGETVTETECHQAVTHNGGEGAEVEGVVRTSSDGSHVYFIANGVLTPEGNTWWNGATKEHECATPGGPNLYGYDTETGEIKFVASTGANDSNQVSNGFPESDLHRLAQTTPDGKYLVFAGPETFANAPAKKHTLARVVYRFDFASGELTWVSHGAPEGEEPMDCASSQNCVAQAEKSALISPLEASNAGADSDINDWNRAISGCPKGVSKEEQEQCPEGQYDGEDIIFRTHEKLQNDDASGAGNLYEWRCSSPCTHPATEGIVHMISDGRDPKGVDDKGVMTAAGEEEAEKAPETDAPFWQGDSAMSASGKDIFFITHTQLVGQDEDILADVYDAREKGGFSAPTIVKPCFPLCQEVEPPPTGPGGASSSKSPPEGNLPAGTLVYPQPASPAPKPKPLTRAQELAKALKTCKKKPKKKQRAACESQARRKYGVKAAVKKAAHKSTRRAA